MEATDEARGHIVRSAFLGPVQLDGSRRLLLHVPCAASALHLTVFGSTTPPRASIRVLTRAEAALRLLGAGWRKLPACLRGDLTGAAGRIRTELGQAPARAGEAPPYAHWIALYDQWGPAERVALAGERMPPIEIVLAGDADDHVHARDILTRAEADTLASIRGGWLQPLAVHIPRLVGAAPRAPGAWLLVVPAGSRLSPHALACFAHAIARGIARDGAARVIVADTDILRDGKRTAPLFKPPADPWLAATPLPTRGACALHPDIPATIADFTGAGASRAVAALGQRIPSAQWMRIPFVLTHLAATPMLPPMPPAIPPLPATWPLISIIIPTALRTPHVLHCLQRLLAFTDYPNFEILLAVSEVLNDDRAQARNLAKVHLLPNVRVLDLGLPAFNYPQVNNLASRAARGDLLLLLNDDVAPMQADWLRRMAAFAVHPENPCGIVGARLLYGNSRVQHGGVIMGLADLCEHAFRLTTREDRGPYGIAAMDRQVSAVTAACLLVHRTLFTELGGLDEGFAIALNDVDFCLRAGQSGARILFAASVELHHFESLSLGRHYQGARAGLEALEVVRLRMRWQSVIADDPFYNPQASLEPGREFQPSFPPRLTPLSWISAEKA